MLNKRIRTDVDSPVNEVAGSVTEKLVFVEVFAGSAKLSKAADQRGLKALPVDTSQNKHRPQHDILIMASHQSASSKPPARRKSTRTPPSKVKHCAL